MPRRAKHSPSLSRLLCALCVLCGEIFLSGCSRPTKFDSSSLTFLIEANPVNLDPPIAKFADGTS